MFKKAMILLEVLIAVLVALTVGCLVFGLVSTANAEETTTPPVVVEWTEEEFWTGLKGYTEAAGGHLLVNEDGDNLIGVVIHTEKFPIPNSIECVVYNRALKRGVWFNNWRTDVEITITTLKLLGIKKNCLLNAESFNILDMASIGKIIYFQ